MDLNAIVDVLSHITAWHWLVLAAVLIGLEAVMPSTFLLWPGIAAIVVGLVAAIDSSLGWQYQLIAFGVLAIVASVAGRYWATTRGTLSDQPKLNKRSAQYVGRRALVADAFVGARGQIVIDDTRWSAETVDGSNPGKGDSVEITAADGVLLKVRRI